MQVQIEQIEGRRMVIRARGNELIVDDTAEAGGPGDGFRPVELLLGALGSCMIGTMINFCRREEIGVGDVVMTLEEETMEHPERIWRIRATMGLATDATERRRETMRRVAGACKIHNTLESAPAIEFVFEVG